MLTRKRLFGLVAVACGLFIPIAFAHWFAILPISNPVPVVGAPTTSAPVVTTTPVSSTTAWFCVRSNGQQDGGPYATSVLGETPCGTLTAGDGVTRYLEERVTATSSTTTTQTSTQITRTRRFEVQGSTQLRVSGAAAQIIVVAGGGGGGSSGGGGESPSASNSCDGVTSSNYYVRDGAIGSGTDWSDAADLPPATITRGTCVWFADGSYGSYTFDDNASGSTVVVFQKATEDAHGTDDGWSSAYGDGQAVFGTITISDPYFVMNGAVRTETTRMEAPAGYGFRVSALSADSGNGDNADFSSFYYLDIGGTWSEETTPTCANTDGSALRFVYNQNDLHFERVAIHNRGSNNSALAMMHGSADVVWDHVDFYQGWGKATIATPNSGQQRHTIRYSRFWNATRSEGSGCGGSGVGITTEIGTYSWAGTTDGNLIYGNIFYGTASGGRNAVLNFGESSPGPDSTNGKAFHNTFVGFPEDPAIGHIVFYGGSGNEARNNLAWDITGSFEITANAASNNVTAMSDPFVDSANLDFRLATDLNGGTDLGSTYDTDPAGTSRASTPDVGAYEYVP